MVEFDIKLQERNLPVEDFVETCRECRMKEVEESKEKLSREQLHSIREIGVLLEEEGGAIPKRA
ncbi:hypothetical protein F4776DRAFT_636120 [Hypoxylon sp. NC0597]|nr:hypothetical protein F4776DRAFT_636120 [Hypoxylon sp. NC0597]